MSYSHLSLPIITNIVLRYIANRVAGAPENRSVANNRDFTLYLTSKSFLSISSVIDYVDTYSRH